MAEMSGYTTDEIINTSFTDYIDPQELPKVIDIYNKRISGKGGPSMHETTLIRKDGGKAYAEINAGTITYQGNPADLVIIRDITERKKAEEERERLILELKEALAKVKTLSGLLPICVSCKKIRDDKGYWNQIESYITSHSEAEFAHSLCPECRKILYPDVE